jgi:hypothetical protein
MCYAAFSLRNLSTETDGSVRHVLPTVVQTAPEQTCIALVLGDAEFDSEKNHIYIRYKLGAQSVISAKREDWSL